MENKKNPKTLEKHTTIWSIPFHPLYEHIYPINPPISFPKTKSNAFNIKKNQYLSSNH
jgi:hypothetical protein